MTASADFPESVPCCEFDTIGRALRWGADHLRAITDRSLVEAERLLAAVLQAERTTLLAHPELALRQAQVQVYAEAVRRRTEGTPLPYILGRVEFFGMELVVTPDVLIPRPETELLVEHAIAWLKARVDAGIRLRDLTVVDVGTGSGCIALAVATASIPAILETERPSDPAAAPRIVATDISAAALAVARTNALRHDVDAGLHWVQADLLSPLVGPIDLILSNPPYVAETEWTELPTSVRQEPEHALLAGPEGLTVIDRLLDQARARLAVGGCLLVEIGARQGDAVRALARTAFPNADVAVLSDLAGRDRLLQIRSLS